MQIPQEKIDEIINKADIVSVVGKYAQLQKKGREYIGLCLFHDDQSPSMMVSPDKKIFKCFSCGVGGNVITFLMKYKHISFVEAAVELAKEFNVDLGNFEINEKPESEEDKYKKVLYAVNEAAMTYYQTVLNSKLGVEAKEYLANRQITKDELVRWNIGYAPGNDSLVKYLSELKVKTTDENGQEKVEPKFSQKNLIDAGVVTLTDSGLHDFHNKRIVFPIRNMEGYVTGFSGRVMDNSKPKYVNSRESLIFKKSNILFNIDEVWKNKERYKYIMVLEGFMDVIALNRVDYSNTLALMGTSLSDFHILVFKQLKKPIKLFLDGDEPGVNAMYKNSPKLIQNKIPFTIVDNTTIHDPDELVTSGQVAELNKMIDRSMNCYEYFIKKWTDDKQLNVDDKREIVNKIFNLLQYETDLLTIDSILNELAKKLGFTYDLLKDQFDTYKQNGHRENYVSETSKENKVKISTDNKTKKTPVRVNKWNNVSPKSADMFARVFLSVVKSSDFIEDIDKDLAIIYPGEYNWQKLIQTIIGYYKSGKYHGDDSVKLSELLQNEKNEKLKWDGKHFKDLMQQELTINHNDSPLTERELNDIMIQSKIDNLRKEMSQVEAATIQLDKQAEAETDPAKLNEIHLKIHENLMLHETKGKQIQKLVNKQKEQELKENK